MKKLQYIAQYAFIAIVAIVAVTISVFTIPSVHAQPQQVPQAGKLIIMGSGLVGDSLATGWSNNTLYGGTNAVNIIEKSTFAKGIQSMSWVSTAPFDVAWFVSPAPIDLSQYIYLNFYAKATQVGQRFEVGLVDQQGILVGNWRNLESGGPPLRPDIWTSYSFPLSSFAATGRPVYGVGFRETLGAPQPKFFMDEIELDQAMVQQLSASESAYLPNVTPVPEEKQPLFYYPQISPWVFIIPALIIMLAIFFE